MNFQLQMRENLQHEFDVFLEGLQYFCAIVLHHKSQSQLVLGCMNFEELLQGITFLG
jgi:hypothetical protein